MSLSQASFEFVRTVLRERSAHSLEDDKAYLVETRLFSVARLHGFESVEELVSHLRRRSKESLLAEIVEAMTINETSFFRDESAFEALRRHVLPELIRHRSRLRCLNLWSASCSSGQEPYSIAMLLHQHFPALAEWNVRLFASDLSETMLARARRGVYSDLEIARGLSSELCGAYFQKQKDGWHIHDDLRRMVEFRQINLSGVWPELPPLDLILLRNVLIYFDLPTKQRILDKAHRALQGHCYLMLGGAESTHNVHDRFLPVSFENVSFFRRTSDRGALLT